MYGKSNMETYITICKIDSQWEFAVWLRKLKQGLCINLEGWDGEGDGREVQKVGDICIPMADSCWHLTKYNKTLWSNYPSIKKLLKRITGIVPFCCPFIDIFSFFSNFYFILEYRASLVAQMVKNLPKISIPGLRQSSGERSGYPLQYSCLENSINRGAWWATVHGVIKSWTRLREFHF